MGYFWNHRTSKLVKLCAERGKAVCDFGKLSGLCVGFLSNFDDNFETLGWFSEKGPKNICSYIATLEGGSEAFG